MTWPFTRRTLSEAKHLWWMPIVAVTLSCSSGSSPSGPSSRTCTITTTSVLVNAGDTLRMKFSVPPHGDADVLNYELDGLPNPLVPGPALSCELFDGGRLLGTDTACKGHWQSSTTSVRLPNAPLIDFAAIAAGTIAGRIDFVITGGSWAFDGKGTVSLGRTIQTDVGPSIQYVAAGVASPLELIGPSCH